MATCSETQKIVDSIIDVGNLLIIDQNPLKDEKNKNEFDENHVKKLCEDNVQNLFNEIWKLPRKNVDHFICAQLPKEIYNLPREKPIPQPRQPTKWEKFAKMKGIVKKKKDRKVFNQTTKEWKPRYGYRRASNDETNKDWLIEIPDQKNPYKDYFEEKKESKRNLKDKYEYQRLKNIARTFKPVGANFVPLGSKVNFKQLNQEISNQMFQAKTATASAGKFQKTIKGEKKPKTGEKRKFAPNENDTKLERERQVNLWTKFQAKKPKLIETRFNAAIQQSNINNSQKKEIKTNKRRSTANDYKKNSNSNKNRQKHFQKVKKGLKNNKKKSF